MEREFKDELIEEVALLRRLINQADARVRRIIFELAKALNINLEEFITMSTAQSGSGTSAAPTPTKIVMTAAQFDQFMANVLAAIQQLQAGLSSPILTDAGSVPAVQAVASALGLPDPTTQNS